MFIDTKSRRFKRKILSEITRVVIPLDRILMNRAGNNIHDRVFPMVFIVGAPRTGSTLLYQVLTNMLDVAYLSNLSNYFYHSLYSGMVLHKIVFRNNPHDSFRSDNGRTAKLIDVNESGKLWYRWFPDTTRIIPISSNDGRYDSLKFTLRSISNNLGKPLIFKNQHFIHRISILADLFPDAKFIHIKRSPLDTACSIIKKRKRFYSDVNKWYSVKPDNYEKIKNLNYKKQVIWQIKGVDDMIEKQLSELNECQYLTIYYENFLDNWNTIIENVCEMLSSYNEVRYRNNAKEPNIKKNEKSLKCKEYETLRLLVEEIYGH